MQKFLDTTQKSRRFFFGTYFSPWLQTDETIKIYKEYS